MSEPSFSKTVLGQALCASGAGVFQVYSGGIAIDTMSTRMQAGQGVREAIFGQGQKPSLQALSRSNLFAGHRVMAQGRFPYLFTNLNVYNATSRRLGSLKMSTAAKEATSIASTTCVSAAVITAIECPKILAQLNPSAAASGSPPTVFSILREQGLSRLLRGYDACICREAFFNAALLGSPAISRAVREHIVEPAAAKASAAEARGVSSGPNGLVAWLLGGRELLATSLLMGMCVGFLTNGPDQLKTRIQHGQFGSLPEALRWQLAHGGGEGALRARRHLPRPLHGPRRARAQLHAAQGRDGRRPASGMVGRDATRARAAEQAPCAQRLRCDIVGRERHGAIRTALAQRRMAHRIRESKLTCMYDLIVCNRYF